MNVFIIIKQLCLFRIFGLNCSIHMDYIYNVFMRFQNVNILGEWTFIEGQKSSGFLKNSLNLCFEITKFLWIWNTIGMSNLKQGVTKP